MADRKFDQFVNGNQVRIGDEVVGLRGSDLANNYRFDFPGDGIQDGDGNYLFQYETVGGAAVNHPVLKNSASLNSVKYSAAGTDANINIEIEPKGTGITIIDGLSFPASDGLTNTLLYTNGAGILDFTTSAYPIVAGTSGTLLQSDGANWINTTAQYPSVSGTSGTLLQSNGASWVNTTAQYPATSGTLGTILRSDGTNWSNTTAAYPSTAFVDGRVLRANGTDWVESTATFADTYTNGSVLYSAGTNNVAGLPSATGAVLGTNGSGIPTFIQGPTGNVLTSNGTGSNPTFQVIARGLQSIKVFETSGIWNKDAGTTHAFVEVVAGGGGSGSCPLSAIGAESDSGGGGGGAYVADFIDVTGTSSETLTVGTGGVGGVISGAAGQPGTSSSFGAFITALPGQGGQNGASTAGSNATGVALGGVASGGLFNIDGGDGSIGRVIQGESLRQHLGGDSYLSTNSSGAGSITSGKKYGGGAPGVNSSGAGRPGGAGAIGVIRVYEYIL